MVVTTKKPLTDFTPQVAESVHDDFCDNAGSQLEGLAHEEKLDLLQIKLNTENTKLRTHGLPDFFINEEAIFEALSLDSTESQKEAIFQEWYSCFSSIEGDKSFVRLVIKHNPELLQGSARTDLQCSSPG